MTRFGERSRPLLNEIRLGLGNGKRLSFSHHRRALTQHFVDVAKPI